MIEIPEANRKDDPKANRNGYMPCIVCGRAVDVEHPHWTVYVHCGGSHIVTDAEYDELEKTDPGAGLGGYPIGPDCLRRHPDIKPYAFRVKPYEPDGVTSVPGFGSITL